MEVTTEWSFHKLLCLAGTWGGGAVEGGCWGQGWSEREMLQLKSSHSRVEARGQISVFLSVRELVLLFASGAVHPSTGHFIGPEKVVFIV